MGASHKQYVPSRGFNFFVRPDRDWPVQEETIPDAARLTRPYGSHDFNRVSTWAAFAVTVYNSSNNYNDTSLRHLFVASVSRVFETMRLRISDSTPVLEWHVHETTAPLADLLSRTVDALRWSLLNFNRDCGAYIPLPWVKDMIQCYEAARNLVDPTKLKDPTNLMDSMDLSHTNSLLAIPLTGRETVRPTFLLVLRLLQTCLERSEETV